MSYQHYNKKTCAWRQLYYLTILKLPATLMTRIDVDTLMIKLMLLFNDIKVMLTII